MNSAGANIIDGDSLLTIQATCEAARTSGVFFGGANARAANGGNAVNLYSPAVYSNGSSVGYLNTDNPAYASFMMKHNRDYDTQQARGWSAIEVGILTDLGYATIVPEPSSLLLVPAGLFGTVGAARRRKLAST